MEYTSSRPSGNQRRYSRRDLESLSAACELSGEGFSPSTIAKILSRERSARSARVTP
jgi:DNA-binding transcriptional MerR regulator